MGLPHGGLLLTFRCKYFAALKCRPVHAFFELGAFFYKLYGILKPDVNRKNNAFFCRHYAVWLLSTRWHYKTLLAISIQVINHLPDDVDKVISELIVTFPNKPTIEELVIYLRANQRVWFWLYRSQTKPNLKSFNLDQQPVLKNREEQQPEIHNKIDLANWLNISLGELEWISNVLRVDQNPDPKLKHYHYSLVEKKRGGYRLIESPKSLLKEIQLKIHLELLNKMPVHDAAHGFRRKRDNISHAKNHCDKKVLILFDIEDCFNSIGWNSAYRSLKCLSYSSEVTKYLTGLCTNQLNKFDLLIKQLSKKQQDLLFRPHLPQGAPTSPMLSNIALYQLDKRLSGLSEKLGLTYSRYADDLAFSTNERRDWKFLETLVGSICLEEGVTLNYRKSRIIKTNQRQKITGVIVNQHLNIDRRQYDRLKAILTNCVRHGLESQNHQDHKFFYAHLKGSVDYVSRLNQNKGAKLQKILDQIIE